MAVWTMRFDKQSMFLMAGGLAAFLAIVAVAGAAQACSTASFASDGGVGGSDNDQDGYNDTGIAALAWNTPYAPEVTLAMTLEDANGSLIGSDSNSVAWEQSPEFWSQVVGVELGATDPAGMYTVRGTIADTGGVCDWENRTVMLYPPGNYSMTASSNAFASGVDEDAAATYHVAVTSHANNPDHWTVTATSSNGWVLDLSADSVDVVGGQTVTFDVTVHAPHNAAPMSLDTTTLLVSSTHLSSYNVSVQLSTTVNAQVYNLEIGAEGTPNGSAPPGGTVHFTVDVMNTGNNHDTITVLAPNAPSGWGISLSANSFQLDVGEGAAFAVNVTVPTSLTGMLEWPVQLIAAAGDTTTTKTTVLHAAIQLPDFVVDASSVSVGVSNPIAGQQVPVVVTVHNVGLAYADPITVSLSDGTTNQTSTVTVGSTGIATVSFTWTALPGTSTLTATADPSGSVPEANDTNNGASVTVVGDAPPTAVVANATASGTTGEAVTISAGSSADSDGTVAAYYYDFGDGTNSDWVTTSQVTHTYAAAGTYTVKVRVRDDQGAESQNVTSTVTVSDAAKGSSPGFDGALAVAAVVGAAALAVTAGSRRARGRR